MDKRIVFGSAVAALLAGGAAVVMGLQKDDASAVGQRAARPQSATGTAPLAIGSARFRVQESGTATFLIDAPLESIKGLSAKFRGEVDFDATDVSKSHGDVDLDLDDLKTETFGNKDKDTAQTEHAHNWLEIGADAKDRDTNRWARFTFNSVESAVPAKLADAPEQNGGRTLKVIAKGDMWLHGITSPKTIKLTVVVRGPLSAPTAIEIKTDEPIRISLKEHDVKPRDVAGKFLSGALEKVGKKIDDVVQISLAVSGSRTAAPQARTP